MFLTDWIDRRISRNEKWKTGFTLSAIFFVGALLTFIGLPDSPMPREAYMSDLQILLANISALILIVTLPLMGYFLGCWRELNYCRGPEVK